MEKKDSMSAHIPSRLEEMGGAAGRLEFPQVPGPGVWQISWIISMTTFRVETLH